MADIIEETTYYDRNEQIVPEGLADKYAVKGRTVTYSRLDGHHMSTQWFLLGGAEERPLLPVDEPDIELEPEPKPKAMAKMSELEASVKAAKTPMEQNEAISKVVEFLAGRKG